MNDYDTTPGTVTGVCRNCGRLMYEKQDVCRRCMLQVHMRMLLERIRTETRNR